MSDSVTNACSQGQLVDLGAIDPKDAARAREFQKEIAPKVEQACKAEARVADAKRKAEEARKAAFDAGVTANQAPTPENEKKRAQAQKNLGAALHELEQAKGALEKLRGELIQAKTRFLTLTQTKPTLPVAARLMGPTPTPKKEAADAPGAGVPDRPMKEHQTATMKARFQLAPQERSGLRGATR